MIGRMTLNDLKKGSDARIIALDVDNETSQRLMVMGLLPEMTVKVVHVAPLGDPIAVEYSGRCLSMRRAEAAEVVVELL